MQRSQFPVLQKIKVGSLQRRVDILDVVLAADGDGVHISEQMLSKCFGHIRRRGKFDHYGIAVDSIRLLARAVPHVVVAFCAVAMSSTALMSDVVIKGTVFGKESSVSHATALRAILPLPAIMQVLDVILSIAMQTEVDALLPGVPECFVGARPKTQCLDVAHGLQAVIEKGLDRFGNAAVAQCDIEKYYDSLTVLRIIRWLISKGVPHSHAACLLRHQMCPRVILRCGSAEVCIPNRTAGGLTGSRIAGLLGRVPVESIISERVGAWRS